ncbi:MAG: sugar transferase [Clostridia bacterium]
MHKLNRYGHSNAVQFLIDSLFLIICYIISCLLMFDKMFIISICEYMWIFIIYTPLWILIMGSLRMYNKTTFNYYDRIFRNIMISTLISAGITSFVIVSIKDNASNRYFLIYLIIFSSLLLLVERYSFIILFKKFRNSVHKSVIIVGQDDIIEKFKYYIDKTNVFMSIKGYVKLSDDTNPTNNDKCLGNLNNLELVIKQNIVDEIIFAVEYNYLSAIEKYILMCEERGLTVSIVPNFYKLKTAKVFLSSIGTLPMITFHTVCLNDSQMLIKRILDIIIAIIGLSVTIGLSIIIIPAILIDSRGPVFFTQERVGLNGRVFKIIKFRSMHVDAEKKKKELLHLNDIKGGLMFKVKTDPRITFVGKILRSTSLDELPQFLNVLKGDMSIVGTRPPTVNEVKNYNYNHLRRISIKPGITGLWQVSGRSTITDFDEIINLDLKYIDNWTIFEDIKILLKTIPVVISRKGAL